MIDGTKTDATLSARRCTGAFEDWASSTIRMIRARAVSPPTLSALNVTDPWILMVPAIISFPLLFSTGMLSPVIMLSSTVVLPEITFPSTGIDSPGLMITVSPVSTSPVGTSITIPLRSTCAIDGLRAISFLIASDVLPFARNSRYLPRRTRVIMIDEASKYKSP